MARLRSERPGDAEAIRRLLTLAFARPSIPVATRAPTCPQTSVPVEAILVDELRVSAAWLPELSMVAELGADATGVETGGDAGAGGRAGVSPGELVGYALLSRVWVGPDRAPALALGPVAVPPARQRAGYGTAVVLAALDVAIGLGERLVVVLGAPDWYRRFGFRPAAELGLTSAWSGPREPWQALVLKPAAVDRLATPATPARLATPDQFGRPDAPDQFGRPDAPSRPAWPGPPDLADPLPTGEVRYPEPWGRI